MSDAATCRHCGAPLRAAARFCGRCGRPTPTEKRTGERRHRRELGRSERVAYAIAVLFAGVILNLVVGWMVGGGEFTGAVVALVFALDVAAAAVALLLLGPGAFAQSLPLRTGVKWVALAVPLGAAAFLFALAYVELMSRLGGSGDGEELDTVTVVSAVIVAPLIEEWLCRGVLWTAVRRVATPRRTVVLTAVLFALMHGLQGMFLALPHRFVGGLVLGWLRLRSGSLVPCVVAHATWNVLAVSV